MKAVSEFTISEINDGAQGAQGVSVTSEQKQYRLSNSSTELTGSGEGYTWSTTMPQVSANTYLWIRTATNLSDNSTIYSNATCDVTISGVVSTVDSVQQSITNKVWSSDISSSINAYDTNNGTETSIRDRVTQTETNISGITSRVSSVETTTGSLGTRMTAAETQIRQTENTIDLLASVTTDGQTQTSTVTLTPEMVTAMTRQFVVKDPDGDETIISGGQIYTGAITTDMIATGAITTNTLDARAVTTAKLDTDAIKSTNYSAPTTATEPYSAAGTFLDLANGNIYSPNFMLDNTNSAAYFNGQVVADSGSIGGWEISDKQIYSSVTIGNKEHSVFLRKYDDSAIIVTTSSYNMTVNYNSNGEFELTPTQDGSGSFSFTYNISDYPTKILYVYDSYSIDRDQRVNLEFYQNGEYSAPVADSVVLKYTTGEQTVRMSSYTQTGGSIRVTIRYTNMAVSDGKYIVKLKITNLNDEEYTIATGTSVSDASLGVTVIGIGQKTATGVVSYPFSVNRRGELFAYNAHINGEVRATSGSFTGTINATDGVFNGTIYATNGSFNGAITAQSGNIGGFTIVQDDTAGMGQTTANDGHVYPTGLYVHTSATEDGVAYEYETGIRGSATQSTDAAFYVRRIASGGQWTQNLDDLVFYVRNNGYFYAKNAKIDGEIKASQFIARYNNSSSSPLVELTGSNLTVSNSSYSTWIAPQFITMNNLSSGSGSVYSRKIQMSANLGYESYNGYAYSSMYANSVDVAYESTPDDDPYTVRHGRFTASSAGNIGIWDVENQNWIIQSTSSYNVNIPHPLTTNSVQIGSTSGTNVKINTGYIDVINTTSDRTCRLVSADSGNIGIYEPTASSYLIYSDTSSQVHVPHMFYCYGKIDETQRCPVGSSNVAKQGMSWMGGTAASTLSIHGQWNSSTSSTKTIAVSSSDIRLKKDITDSQVDALEVINRVKLREFTWKDDGVRQKIGVVVDELEELDPLLSVGGGEDENGEPIYKSVNNLLMISYLTKAVQQLSAQVDSLQNEIKELKGDK